MQKRTEAKLQDLPVVLGAGCVLHNICEKRKDENNEMVLEDSLRSMTSMQGQGITSGTVCCIVGSSDKVFFR